NKRHLEKRPLSQPFKIAGFRNLALPIPTTFTQRSSAPLPDGLNELIRMARADHRHKKTDPNQRFGSVYQ
ncbi:hypothetical protein, partial [Aeromonas veronii]